MSRGARPGEPRRATARRSHPLAALLWVGASWIIASALLAALGAGCGAAHTGHRGPVNTRGSGLPPLESEEDLRLALGDFDELAPGSPRRAPLLRALLAAAGRLLENRLAAGEPEEAFFGFRQLLVLFTPADLGWAVDRLVSPLEVGDDFLRATASLERAFGRRGAERETLTALAVLATFRPGDRAPRARLGELMRWLDEADSNRPDRLRQGRRIELLEQVVGDFAAPLLVEHLDALYRQRLQAFERLGRHGLADAMRELMAVHEGSARAPQARAMLYLRVDRLVEAAAAIRAGSGQPGDDPKLRQLLAQAAGERPAAADFVALASHLRAAQPSRDDVALRVCLLASRRFPRHAGPHLCAGEAAAETDRFHLAIREYQAARLIEPRRRETYDALARLYQRRLLDLVADEQVARAATELEQAEEFHRQAARLFPGKPLSPSTAGLYFEMGRGTFNAGEIEHAIGLLERSLRIEENVPALEQLARIRMGRGDPRAALALLRRAIALGHRRPELALYQAARLRRALADAEEAAGELAAAHAARAAAIAEWQQLLGLGLTPIGKAEVLEGIGTLLFDLGEPERAVLALRKAVETAPQRSESYAGILAFLVSRGCVDAALDIYHRALGRAEISEYIKIYCTLWVRNLLCRAGRPEDPLAEAFLRGVRGSKWHHQLARFAVGALTFEGLWRLADSRGKQAEATFYQAMERLAAGDQAAARAGWQRVLASDLMGFFEFDMARAYLRRGAPTTPLAPPRGPAAVPQSI